MKPISLPAIFAIAGMILMHSVCSAQVSPVNASVPAAATVVTRPSDYAAGTPVNTIRTWQAIKPVTTESALLMGLKEDVQQTTDFIDGLGRPLQTVKKAGSPKGLDIVTPVYYDAFGRESLKYLPYQAGTADGNFKNSPFTDQNYFYQSTYPVSQPSLTGEQVYYAKTDYETSPLNRVLKTSAPGNSWAGNGNGVSISYQVNTGAEEVIIWSIGQQGGSLPVAGGFYPAGTLYRTVTADENGKKVAEYKDKEGHVVLKKVEVSASAAVDGHDGWLCTYYIYDDLNNLRFVIQPRGTELLKGAGWTFNAPGWNTSELAKEFCFIYEYDARNRMVVKRVPGADEVNMVYDARNRLVLTQDGNRRQASQWLVTQYDELNRPVRTLLWNNSAGMASHQSAAWNSVSYPDLSGGGTELLTVTHYDNYDWMAGEGGGLTAAFESAETSSGFRAASDVTTPYARSIVASSALKGLVTGTQTRILGSSDFLYSVNFYDDRNRLIQVKSKNITGGTDILTTQYSFDGKILGTKLHHQAINTTPGSVTVVTTNYYDHAGGLTQVTKQVNGGDIVAVARSSYDELGKLQTKLLGQQKSGGVYNANAIETLNYDYNIRGWITGINKEYALNPSGGHYFGERLSYDYGFSANQLNGNIAGIIWSSANDQQSRAYGYSYDPASRLLKADFTEQNGGSWNTNLGRDYTTIMGDGVNASSAYDANGNINRMRHFVAPGNAIDDLTYNYDQVKPGNKLWYVTDAQNNPNSTLGDFKELSTGTAQDYTYDNNGNLQQDLNKGISSITYNQLNLPAVINITGKGTIAYTYDAIGNKLKKQVTDATNSNTVTTTTYINGFEYENNDLKQFGHEEGRVRRKTDGSYVYDYFVKDHLGSVRATLTEEESVQVYRMATMELDSAQQEETYYSNVAETRSVKPMGYSDTDNANQYVAKLDGRQKKIGPAILLKVMAGDKINIQAKSWYRHNGRKSQLTKQTLAEQAAGLAGGGSAGVVHTSSLGQGATASVLVPGLISFLSTRDGKEQAINKKPKAYLNWMLLDEDLKPFKTDTTKNLLKKAEYTGFQQVGEEEELKQHVKDNWEVAKSGYVYIFTSNESADADVIFEDLGVTAVQGPLLEVNHTYPFGLTMAGISSKAVGKLQNRLKYNSKELQSEEFSDGSGFELYDYGARFYDPQLGRWHTQDPLVEDQYYYDEGKDNGWLAAEIKEKFMPLDGEDSREMKYLSVEVLAENSAIHYNMSSYAYVLNNPNNFIDPFGLDTTKATLPNVTVTGIRVNSENMFNFSNFRWPVYVGGVMATPIPKRWFGPVLRNTSESTTILSKVLGEWKKPISLLGKTRLYTHTVNGSKRYASTWGRYLGRWGSKCLFRLASAYAIYDGISSLTTWAQQFNGNPSSAPNLNSSINLPDNTYNKINIKEPL